MSVPTDRLVAEALAKSGLLWLSSPAGSSPVWHAHVGGIAYVVTGEGEQETPIHSGPVHVITRSKESRARLISFEAEATRLLPEDEDWEAATFALVAGRLNAPTDDLVERWRESGYIMRISPDVHSVVMRGELLDGPPSETPEPTDGPGESPHEGAPGTGATPPPPSPVEGETPPSPGATKVEP